MRAPSIHSLRTCSHRSLHDIAVVAEDILKESNATDLKDSVFIEDDDERSLVLVNKLTQLLERRNAEIESLRTSLERANTSNEQLLEHLERKEKVREFNLETLKQHASSNGRGARGESELPTKPNGGAEVEVSADTDVRSSSTHVKQDENKE